jgi:fructosamine-3-kinase
LLVARADGRRSVAKGGPAVAVEAAMLRALAGTGMPVPLVEAEHDGVMLLEYVENDRVFSPAAWRDIGRHVAALHGRRGERFGWPVDYRIGTVELDNKERDFWPDFWAEQRLIATARVLDRPWRERVERLSRSLAERLPEAPPAAFLHGDLWAGNVLVREGRLAALIDPACYFGDAEVDLAMLTLFDTPSPDFWDSYGPLEPEWRDRRAIYQLFPALVHLRLFGGAYAAMADRLLTSAGA